MPNGVEGWGGYYLSAYGLAVKHGFRGSEAEWLEFLRAGAVQIKVEGGRMYWKTDKDTEWEEVKEYKEQITASAEMAKKAADAAELAASNLTATKEAAEEATRKAESAGEDAVAAAQAAAEKAAAAETATSQALSAKEAATAAAGEATTAARDATEAKESIDLVITSATQADEKITAAQAEFERLSAETEGLNQQVVQAASKIDSLITMKKETNSVQEGSPLEYKHILVTYEEGSYEV